MMNMVQLNDLLPLSERETYWTFYGEDHEGLPKDAVYVIFEYYCSNVECDCQRLIADVMQIGSDGEHIEKSLAIINYNWSSKKTACYPTLEEKSPQTTLALRLLEAYKKFIHCDEYLDRIKHQYANVKRLALERCLQKSFVVRPNQNVGRNDPCPCGSSKKYKRCCLNTELSQNK